MEEDESGDDRQPTGELESGVEPWSLILDM
jgi:hypothetical protein